MTDNARIRPLWEVIPSPERRQRRHRQPAPRLRRLDLTLDRREHRAQHARVVDDRDLLHALLETPRTLCFLTVMFRRSGLTS